MVEYHGGDDVSDIRVLDRYRGAPAVRERLALHIAEPETTAATANDDG